jgi:hypothetical protein
MPTMLSKPNRNMVHVVLLALWALVGLVVTLGGFADPWNFLVAIAFWLWFAGFAAATTLLVARTGTPLAALGVHGGFLLAQSLVPRVFPLSLLRVGLDVLGKS